MSVDQLLYFLEVTSLPCEPDEGIIVDGLVIAEWQRRGGVWDQAAIPVCYDRVCSKFRNALWLNRLAQVVMRHRLCWPKLIVVFLCNLKWVLVGIVTLKYTTTTSFQSFRLLLLPFICPLWIMQKTYSNFITAY